MTSLALTIADGYDRLAERVELQRAQNDPNALNWRRCKMIAPGAAEVPIDAQPSHTCPPWDWASMRAEGIYVPLTELSPGAPIGPPDLDREIKAPDVLPGTRTRPR